MAEVPIGNIEQEQQLINLAVQSEFSLDDLKGAYYSGNWIRFTIDQAGTIHLGTGQERHIHQRHRLGIAYDSEYAEGWLEFLKEEPKLILRDNTEGQIRMIHRIGINIEDAQQKCWQAIRNYLGI